MAEIVSPPFRIGLYVNSSGCQSYLIQPSKTIFSWEVDLPPILPPADPFLGDADHG